MCDVALKRNAKCVRELTWLTSSRTQNVIGNVPDKNKKPEPIPHREEVRIFHVWWTIQDSIADFAPWGKIIWMQPVFELPQAATGILHLDGFKSYTVR